MGHKTHPIGFRLGVIKDWHAKWFAHRGSDYRALVLEDLSIRKTIMDRFVDAGISQVDIERGSNEVIITIHTARPGIVIGRGGQRVEELRRSLEGITERRARLNVQEIRQPELDAFLVARSVADQLERRIAFRRAMRQAAYRTIQAGAEGVKLMVSGRLGGGDIARREKFMEGRVPLHTLRADIDYGLAEAATEYGQIGVKAWIFKGEVLESPKQEQQEADDIPTIEVTLTPDRPEDTLEEGTGAETLQPAVEAVEAQAADVEAPKPAVEAVETQVADVEAPEPAVDAVETQAADVEAEEAGPAEGETDATTQES